MSEQRRTGWEEADRWFAPGAQTPDAGDAVPVTPNPACTVCGAALETDQTYCLECGSPTPLAPRLRRGGRNAAILAGAIIVLGLGAGALAYAMVNDDEPVSTVTTPSTVLVAPTQATVILPPTTATAPSTGPLPADPSVTTPTAPIPTTPSTAPTTTGFSTVTGPSSTPTTAPTTPTTATTTVATTVTRTATVPAAGRDSDWPAGRTAWTAVLASVRSEPDARAAKARVAAGGNPAGVLFSTDFSVLRSGYWVVFSGIYDSRVSAIAQATKLRGGFPRAYARRIEG